MEIKKVAVIGVGAMGSGIAYICAAKGYDVAAREVNEDFLKSGMKKIRELVVGGVNRGKLSPKEAEDIMKRIKGTTDLGEAVKEADLVIEAIIEDIEAKKELFKKLDETCPVHTILASNTSALSIDEMASATSRPEKVVGMHFFNPPYAMKLVEVVVGEETSEETRKTANDFLLSLDKKTVKVKDIPGFIVNRILGAASGEAFYLLYKGVASIEDIDKACELGLNWPMGPFRLADYVGLDISLHTGETLAKHMDEEYLRERKEANKILEEKVKAGHLGMKTRKGFYEY